MTVLGVELSATRLLDPFFGNSLVIWAAVIGLMLLYLTVGYLIGGRWADRDPRPSTLLQITAWGAFGVGVIPFLAAPVLRWSLHGFAESSAGVLVGSLIGVLVLFSVPITLLGTVSPFAIRLALEDVQRGGRVAGRVFAVSTLGSLIGTFLPVLVLIPAIGTRLTFLTFAGVLLLASLAGLLIVRSRRAWICAAMMAALAAATLLWPAGPIKPVAGAVYETESRYNYIQVAEWDDDQGTAWRLLYLNEGGGYHSAYGPASPEFPLVGGCWDYFLLAPCFRNPPLAEGDVRSLLVIGSAAGTISKAYTRVYGPIPIDGVEIDREIVEVGRKWFDMNEPNLTVHVEDGRTFLARTDHAWDVIVVDAYRPPYIPFHLTTREFFQEISDHLSEDGVVAINAVRSGVDYALVEALGTTMCSVFPDVYVLDAPDYGSPLGNSLVIATKEPSRLENFELNAGRLRHPILRLLAERVRGGRIRAFEPDEDGLVFTDDRAPVEQVIHRLILRYLLGS